MHFAASSGRTLVSNNSIPLCAQTGIAAASKNSVDRRPIQSAYFVMLVMYAMIFKISSCVTRFPKDCIAPVAPA